MCYNFCVKRKSLFTISLCVAFATAGTAAFGAPFVAAAATSATDYPDIFIETVNANLDGLKDFATDGKSYAFADDTGITVVENGERTQYDISKVDALHCEDGVYYYKSKGNTYSLPSDGEGKPELSVFNNFPADYMSAVLDNGNYEIIENKCCYHAKGTYSYDPIDNENYCAKLKVYNDVAYALIESDKANDNGNTLTVKKLDGTKSYDINPTYIDFKGVMGIELGTIKSSLLNYNLSAPHFAKLESGSYYTQIDIENLSGKYFKLGDNGSAEESTAEIKEKLYYTFKCGDEDAISSDTTLLVLGESGNATVFTYEDKCYIALTQKLSPEEVSLENTAFNALINAPDWIYSSPYPCTATKAVELTALDTVRVTGKVATTISGRQFYHVQFYKGDEQVTGYVLENFLSSYSESEHPDDKNFGTIVDPEYSEDDLVKIVVLLLIVIVLVLIGLTYITYVLTSKKRKALKQAEGQTDEANSPKPEEPKK